MTESVAEAVFELDGKKIHLIGSPDIDYTTRAIEDIGLPVTSWLAAAYGITKVDSAIYTHHISNDGIPSQLRTLYITLRSRGLIEELSKIAIVTTMWDAVDKKTGEARELVLSSHYFRALIEGGSSMYRDDGTRDSALRIMRSLSSGERLESLRIQRELVNKTRLLDPSKATQRGSVDKARSLGSPAIQDYLRDLNDSRLARHISAELSSLSGSLPDIPQVSKPLSISNMGASTLLSSADSRGSVDTIDPLIPEHMWLQEGPDGVLGAPAPAILQCPFNFLRCFRTFADFGQWVSHSLTHFQWEDPPTHTKCYFCKKGFENSARQECWWHLLKHVELHHRQGESLTDFPLNLPLIEYLRNRGLINDVDYRLLTTRSERPSGSFGQGFPGSSAYDLQNDPIFTRSVEHSSPRRERRRHLEAAADGFKSYLARRQSGSRASSTRTPEHEARTENTENRPGQISRRALHEERVAIRAEIHRNSLHALRGWLPQYASEGILGEQIYKVFKSLEEDDCTPISGQSSGTVQSPKFPIDKDL